MIKDYIRDKLSLEGSNLILLEDKDDILNEESIIEMLHRDEYEVYNYQEPDSFRFYYELNYRKFYDSFVEPNKKFILKCKEINEIPYDIQTVFHHVSISLKEIFPKLDYAVLKELGTDFLGKIYEAYQLYDGNVLGENGTKDYVMKAVFGIIPEHINNLNELVKAFLRLYYKNMELHKVLSDYLEYKLRQKENLKDVPLNEILSGKDRFFRFVRVQWKNYINDLIEGTHNAKIDFSDYDIRAYLDNIFYEKYIEPIEMENIERLPKWTYVGILYDENERYLKEYRKMIEKIKELLSFSKSYKDWMNLSSLWAEVLNIFYSKKLALNENEFNEISKLIENSFMEWVVLYYSNLTSISYVNGPVMVHQIPWYLNYIMKKQKYNRIALLVFDGMSVDNWYLIRRYLNKNALWNIEEKKSFAWIPTLTSISRQAIFSGDIPLYFKDTIFSTNYEEKRWKKFWMNQGYKGDDVFYIKNVMEFNKREINDIINNRNAKIVGIVVNIIDELIHSAILSIEGLYQNIQLWLEKSRMEDFLKKLISKGFEIFIASDHGNVASIGKGKLNEGLLVEKAGERVRIYESGIDYGRSLYDDKSFKCIGFGLPKEYNFIICKENNAFGAQGEQMISHGGISIEEVIVPFVHISHI
ncbi:PglZ domain-containing protein [Thermoanaerobacter thermohydrosulfuricus]|nr:PglZ domain-containing protein [Thermoanaerobacter thermohydrosulfuricus]